MDGSAGSREMFIDMPLWEPTKAKKKAEAPKPKRPKRYRCEVPGCGIEADSPAGLCRPEEIR